MGISFKGAWSKSKDAPLSLRTSCHLNVHFFSISCHIWLMTSPVFFFWGDGFPAIFESRHGDFAKLGLDMSIPNVTLRYIKNIQFLEKHIWNPTWFGTLPWFGPVTSPIRNHLFLGALPKAVRAPLLAAAAQCNWMVRWRCHLGVFFSPGICWVGSHF